jgi:uncharacterized protein (TIGR02594 family)
VPGNREKGVEMSKLGAAATLPRFQSLEQRLKDAGLYKGPIDSDWADGVDQAIDQLFKKAGFAPATSATPSEPHAIDASSVRWPVAYAWLSTLGDLPRLTVAAGELLGTKETPGAGSSPIIMGWKDELAKLGKDVAGYTSDAVPWCGLGMGKIALDAGYAPEIPQHPLWALNWGDFGVAAKQPCLGSILTFVRDSGGHVAQYVAEDQVAYHVIGCNEQDMVTIVRIQKSRLHAAREPAYQVRPESARPFIVAPSGLLSSNER